MLLLQKNGCENAYNKADMEFRKKILKEDTSIRFKI